ncbi:MAG: OB-fold nucleic acid binding domain-containing protein [Candidatus Aenigmatarchaeota archaeon]
MPSPNHYQVRKISEINPETDFKVSIIGIVVDKKDDTIIIDDGHGKIQVFVNYPEITEKLKPNQIVRVFGVIVPLDEGFEVKADIVQDLSGFDINLYKKIEELYNRVGV